VLMIDTYLELAKAVFNNEDDTNVPRKSGAGAGNNEREQ